ncbi:MAG: rRNA adenine N-6-methyltransferase family protein [Acidimicrobiales bacterium]
MRATSPTWWGWHRLADEWAAAIVARAHIAPGDLVLDIGAGTGALTAPLIAAGAVVIAFELHPGRAAQLRRTFAGTKVTVVRCDAADLRLPRRPFKVVANPPFAITTALMRRLLAPSTRLATADLIVPPHVAARWAATGGQFDLSIDRFLPRRAFHPPPPAPACVLRISRRSPGRRG